MVTAKEMITEAIVVLDRDGWCQGAETNNRGQRCAVGALKSAYKVRAPVQFDTFLEAIETVRREVGSVQLSYWNDQEGRTQAEVRAAFVRALEKGEG